MKRIQGNPQKLRNALSRREFFRDAGIGTCTFAGVFGTANMFVAQAVRKPLTDSARWAARVSSSGHYIELAYGGETWITNLRVEVYAGSRKLSSDAPGTHLMLSPGAHLTETMVSVRGFHRFDIVLKSTGLGVALELRGVSSDSEASALVEAEIHAGRRPLHVRLDDLGDDVQQMASGRAVSRLNNVVFDPFRDEGLKVMSRRTTFEPCPGGFRVRAITPLSGSPVCRFILCERVYASHLPFYEPLDKGKWPRAPVGWCSWYFYYSHVTEQDILRNAKALGRDFKAFGLSYCLIDAGWQRVGNRRTNEAIGGNWTMANSQFPHGMKWVADRIRANGLKPGLWLSVFGNADEEFYKAHSTWFLHNGEGDPELGSWFGTYVADFSNPGLKNYLYEVYRHHIIDWGFDYFKLDGEDETRDIWARNRIRAYDPTLDADTAFRETLRLIRQAMNSKPGTFFSACGPVYPVQSMGIAQSARLGRDVIRDTETPSFRGVRTALEGMRRGYYTHNIAWYADPDVLVVRPPLTDDEARTWTSMLGLSGQLLMLGDDVASLPDVRREMLRKVMPVADITPMDLYPLREDRHIWVLHVARPFGDWAVVGLFNWDRTPDEMPPFLEDRMLQIVDQNQRLQGEPHNFGSTVSSLNAARRENDRLKKLSEKPAGLQLLPVSSYLTPPDPRRIVLDFAKIGLDATRDYLLYDFWNSKFIGRMRNKYSVVLPPHACQVISLRPFGDRPQIIGTDRHITMGGVELKDESWDVESKQLRFAIQLVGKYPTMVTVYRGTWTLRQHVVSGARIAVISQERLEYVRLESIRSGLATVVLEFL